MRQRVTMSEREGLIELHYLFEVFKLNSILSRCNIMDYKIKTTFFAHVIVLCTEHQVYAIRVLRTSCLCTIVFACDSVTVWVVPFWLALRQSCHMPSVAKQKKRKGNRKQNNYHSCIIYILLLMHVKREVVAKPKIHHMRFHQRYSTLTTRFLKKEVMSCV